jgi:hypothetical protein
VKAKFGPNSLEMYVLIIGIYFIAKNAPKNSQEAPKVTRKFEMTLSIYAISSYERDLTIN